MFFDGVTVPQVMLLAAFNGTTTTNPQSGSLVLDVGPGLDTGTLGAITWTDITSDLLTIDVQPRSAGEVEPAAPRQAAFVLDNTAGTYDPTNAAGPYFGLLNPGIPVWYRSIWQNTTYDRFYGYLDDPGMDAGTEPTVTWNCLDGLDVLGHTKLATISSSFAGDLTGTRVGRILDGVTWPADQRSIDAGISTCQATTYGDFALPLLQQVADTELGVIFIDGAGNVVFYDRWRLYTQTRSTSVQATLSDVGTDVDFLSLAVSARSRQFVFNQAAVTRTGGTEQVANDTASQAAYGVRTFPGSPGALLETDPAALDMAQWLVSKYKNPDTRVTAVTVDAAAQGMWATVLPLRIWDRVRVLRDYGPVTLDMQVLVDGIAEHVDQDSWTFQFTTRQPDRALPIILDVGPPLDTGTLGF